MFVSSFYLLGKIYSFIFSVTLLSVTTILFYSDYYRHFWYELLVDCFTRAALFLQILHSSSNLISCCISHIYIENSIYYNAVLSLSLYLVIILLA